MVAQGLLDFQYEHDSSNQGLTSLAGLPVYLDLIKAMASVQQSGGMLVRPGARAGSTSRWFWR